MQHTCSPCHSVLLCFWSCKAHWVALSMKCAVERKENCSSWPLFQWNFIMRSWQTTIAHKKHCTNSPLASHRQYGRQESGGVPHLGRTWPGAGPLGDLSGRASGQLPGQVHPGTLWRESGDHARQGAACCARPGLQQVGGGLLRWESGAIWQPWQHLWPL